MSHNATGYNEDMNPDLIDGIHSPRNQWSANNVRGRWRPRRSSPGLIPAASSTITRRAT